MSILKLYCDGGVHGGRNPGTSVYWSVGKGIGDDGMGTEIVVQDGSPDHTTNNESEYLALISALQYAFQNSDGVQRVVVHSDSQLIVQHFNGNWRCSAEHLLPLLAKARNSRDFLKRAGIDVDVVHVRRAVSARRLGH